MDKILAIAALVFLLQPAAWADGRAEHARPAEPSRARVVEQTDHYQILAQGQFFIVSCSRNDLFQRCSSLDEARRVAEGHQRATGHRVGISRE